MTHHSELLNFIARKIKAKYYLEIGVFNTAHNFDKIDVELKISVDPDPGAGAIFKKTSDDFFAHLPDARFDLILVDGLHHADQAKKDILNAWKALNPGGAIVIHDSNPPTEITTCVPRGEQREWCGDVYKTICQLSYSKAFTVDMDYGCCVIKKTTDNEYPIFSDRKFTWNEFDVDRDRLLNLKSVDESKKIINSW